MIAALRQSDRVPQNDAADELLTATQVGRMIDRSSRTVIRLAENGEIPQAGKLPGRNGAYLFRRGDAEKLVAKLAAADEQVSA